MTYSQQILKNFFNGFEYIGKVYRYHFARTSKDNINWNNDYYEDLLISRDTVDYRDQTLIVF